MVVVNTKTRHVTVEITRGPKGAPFTYEDFTPEQLEGLKLRFADLTAEDKEELKLSFEDLTPEEKDELSLKWDQLTEQQKAELKGEKGDAFTFEDFTAAQLSALKGDKGDPFTYEDFTQAQKDEIFNTFLSNFYDPSVVALSSRGNNEGATFEVKLNKIQEQMNILDPKPSLLMLPSGVKAGKLYSVLPEDGTGDFTVERNSEATRINQERNIEIVAPNVPAIDWSTGEPMVLVEGAATNYIFPSDAGIGGSQASIIDLINAQRVLDPMQGMNARLITPSGTASRFEYIINNTDPVYTFSWYSKRVSNPVDPQYTGDLYFLSPVNLNITDVKLIESLSNGWNRYSARVTKNTPANQSTLRAYFGYIIGVENQSVAYFGHQLEEGCKATSYIPTNGMIATRLADNIFQTFPKTGNAVITFADGTVQTISGNEGDTLTLPQGLIKRVEML